MCKNVVIIGGGVAAISAVKAIREIDNEIDIYMFQEEEIYPYYRIRLTKNLFDDINPDKILLQKKEWYEQNNVKLYLNKEVVGVDTDNCKITLSDGSSFEYDKLLLANGANNFTPPIDGINKENIYTIRRFDDIQAIRSNIDNKKVILNIGGGIQGLEAAWAECTQGKEVIIAEVQERLMPHQLDRRASEIILKVIEDFNVKVLLNTHIEKIIGENEVQGVLTKDGDTIDCDMIIYSIGIRSDKSLFENTPIKTNKGVIVNDKMETSVENIYAAGDIAEFNGRIGGLWKIAIEQGKTAGYSIAGRESAYNDSIPSVMMNAFNISLFSGGNIDENSCEKILTDEGSDKIYYRKVFIRDNKIAGAIVIGDTKSAALLKDIIEKEVTLSGIDLSNITIDDLIIKLKNK